MLLVEGTNRPPERLALGVVHHGQAEPGQHPGHQEILLGPHPSVRPVVSAVPAPSSGISCSSSEQGQGGARATCCEGDVHGLQGHCPGDF